MTDGGEGGAVIMNEETRAKLSHPGEKNGFFGKKHSRETKALISAANSGKKRAQFEIKRCITCSADYKVSLGQSGQKKRLFCSKQCFWKSGRLRFTGKKHA